MPICLYDIVPGRDAVARASAAEYLAKAAKRGEGSHGGHIIGHTKSGKAIYGHRSEVHQGIRSSFPPTSQKDRSHSGFKTARRDNLALVMRTHPNFTAHEHVDAARAHAKKSQAGKRRWKDFGYNGDTPDDYKKATDDHELHAALQNAHAEAAEKLGWTPEMSSTYKSLTKAAKRGEGSRGGHIVGHTRSGKPIYAEAVGGSHTLVDKDGALTGGRTKSGKWIHTIDAPHYRSVRSHYEQPALDGKPPRKAQAVRAMINRHPGWSAQDHSDAAEHHLMSVEPEWLPANKERALNTIRAHIGAAAKLGGEVGAKAADEVTLRRRPVDHHHSSNYHGLRLIGAERNRTQSPSQVVHKRLTNKALISSAFPDYSAEDHEHAAEHHEQQAAAWLQRGDSDVSKVGHEIGVSAAQAHRDVAQGFAG